jgi:hypothetical protein
MDDLVYYDMEGLRCMNVHTKYLWYRLKREGKNSGLGLLYLKIATLTIVTVTIRHPDPPKLEIRNSKELTERQCSQIERTDMIHTGTSSTPPIVQLNAPDRMEHSTQHHP